ncbi:myotilin [Brachionichthys hirsutus]|uniref:myotilin n=1 Tax=Brachionichthys hirsutus TaxID=412623 RepID=UPI0036046276
MEQCDRSIQRVQKKTSTMSLTISSSLAQRHSSLVQPLRVSPQTTQSPRVQYSGKGVAPSFVKCLRDASAVKAQLAVLECRLRGTPPLQVIWYRDDQQVLDSADLRILRKKASSASVPEELCTLVITEAFPEDSGLFKCVALNSFGTASCSATLEVYNDLQEQLEIEAARQQEAVSLKQAKEEEAVHQQDVDSCSKDSEEFPSELPDPVALPPPEWPDSPAFDNIPAADRPEAQPADRSSEEPFGPSPEERCLDSGGRSSAEVTPSPLPPPSPSPSPPPTLTRAEEAAQTAKLFSPSKLSLTSSQSGGDNMNRSGLPTFSASSFPPSAFNYERPRHFIQSQPSFQAPSYESVVREAQQHQSDPQQNLSASQNSPAAAPSQSTQTLSRSRSVSQIQTQTQNQAQFQSLSLGQNQSKSVHQIQIQTQAKSTSKSSPSSPSPSASSSSFPRATLRSTITLTPSVPSATGLGSATLPANQDSMSAPAAYLCSVLPSQSAFSPFSSSKLSPNSNAPPPPTTTSCSPPAPSSPSSPPSLPQRPLPVSPSPPRSPVSPSSSCLPQPGAPPGQTSVSLPIGYKGTPNILPKPILRKSVAPRPPSSRSTEGDIQGSKDALIQDLEKKLRSKEARGRSSQKLSYEERMARRLLGPDNGTDTLDQNSLSDQSDAPEGRHTGGLWGMRHSGTDERTNEGSAIQEKCYAPRFLQVPADLTVEEGRFCRIDFKVGGLPTPDICWYLDGKAIRPDDYHKMLVCEKGMHSFIIEIVTVHHAGVHECVARNRAGESRFTLRLDVIAQVVLRPPTFVQKMLNSRALEGDTMRLEYKVDASPPPELFWKKDKDMLRIDPNRMSLYQDGSGRQCLLIERVQKSDAGWYTLSAINVAGMSTCNTRLDVGTRTAPPLKTAPPGSKSLKLLSSLSYVPAPTAESPAQHTAPLHESEEL